MVANFQETRETASTGFPEEFDGRLFVVATNGNGRELFMLSVSSAPSDILLTSDSVAEGLPVGTVVGTFLSVDPDLGGSHTFELVSGPGDDGNASFVVVGDQLLTNQVFQYTTQSFYSIRVRATDSRGLSVDKTLSLHITNVAPRVSAVHVRGSDWNPQYLSLLESTGVGSALYGFRLVDGPQQLELSSLVTWRTINILALTFTEPVHIQADALRLLDSNNSDVSLLVGGFSYNPNTWTAQWSLATPLTPGKFLISLDATLITDAVNAELDGEWGTSVDTFATSGDGNPGGDFHFRFNYLPGDVNRSGRTDTTDRNLILSAGNVQPNTSNYLLDVTANHRVNNGDANYVRDLGILDLDDFPEPTIPPDSQFILQSASHGGKPSESGGWASAAPLLITPSVDWGARVDQLWAKTERGNQRSVAIISSSQHRSITHVSNIASNTAVAPLAERRHTPPQRASDRGG